MFIWLTTGKGRPDGNMILIYMIKKKKKNDSQLVYFFVALSVYFYIHKLR